ncbi:hypothetical protein LCGC14_1137020, partial [marine sediment metagenome]
MSAKSSRKRSPAPSQKQKLFRIDANLAAIFEAWCQTRGIKQEQAAEAAAVAKATVELTDYLLGLHAAGRLKTDFESLGDLSLAYHAPCHLKVLHDRRGADLAELIPGVRVERIERSCCGLAGTFGFQRTKYDLSLAIGEPMLSALRTAEVDMG